MESVALLMHVNKTLERSHDNSCQSILLDGFLFAKMVLVGLAVLYCCK